MTDAPLPAAGTRTVRELQSRLAHFDKFPTLDPMGRRRTRIMTGLPFRLIEAGLPMSARTDADLRTRWGTVPPEQQIRDYFASANQPGGPMNDMVGNLDALIWMMGDAEHRAFSSLTNTIDRLALAARLVTPGA